MLTRSYDPGRRTLWDLGSGIGPPSVSCPYEARLRLALRLTLHSKSALLELMFVAITLCRMSPPSSTSTRKKMSMDVSTLNVKVATLASGILTHT